MRDEGATQTTPPSPCILHPSAFRLPKLRLVVLLGLALAIGGTLYYLPALKGELKQFLMGVRELGPWGPVAAAAIYVPACLFFFPGSIISLGIGLVFKVVLGTIIVSIGSTAGASAAFWAGRTLARGWIEEKISRNPRFRAIDRAVGKHGFKIVLLTRLSPAIPFNLLNYAFGLTQVRFRDYLLASWLGMLPATVLYVYLGSALGDLADLDTSPLESTLEQRILFFVGLLATVVVTILVTRIARKALTQALTEEGGGI